MELNTKICFLGRHDTKNNIFKLHSHDCYEAVYFLSGSGNVLIDGKSHPVSAHSYYIISPKSKHVEAIEGYGEILFIGFEYDAVYPLNGGICYNDDRTVLSLFEKIFAEYRQQALGFETAGGSLLRLFLLTVLRSTQSEDRKCKDLQYIKAYIEQYADQKLNFKELAALSGYSYDYFRHIFKQRFGVSPQEYMIDIRLSNARQLLETTSLSCTEIAYRCGFSNSAQLTSMFKAKFGKSPTAFKKADLYKTIYES